MLINSEDLKGHMNHLFFSNYFSVSLKLDSPSSHSLYIDGVAKKKENKAIKGWWNVMRMTEFSFWGEFIFFKSSLTEELFCLGPDELGCLADKDKPEAKVCMNVCKWEMNKRLYMFLYRADE